MSELLDKVAESYPVTLDDMVKESTERPVRLPEASARNQAALTALLSSDPASAYTQIRTEQQEGVSYTKDKIYNEAAQKHVVANRPHVMSILADPNIPLEQKSVIIANLQQPVETSEVIATEAAVASVKNESAEAESARINTANMFKDIRQAREDKQTLMNSQFARLNPSFDKLAVDVAEQLIPFVNQKEAYSVLNDILRLVGIEESKKLTMFAPGSSKAQIRERLSRIAPQDQAVIHKRIADILMTTPDITFTKDSHYARLKLMQELLDDDGYSTVQKYVDNTMWALDVLTVGTASPILKGIGKLLIRTENRARNIDLRNITAPTSPVSPIKVLEDSNPEKARALYTAAIKADGDEVAKAVSGTDKQGLIADAHLPQPTGVDGSVEARLVDPNKKLREMELDERLLLSLIIPEVSGLV